MLPENVDPRQELGRRLAARRIERKLTVAGLAAAARNLDESNIRKIEAGGNPTLEKLLRIAGALELDLAELFRGIDPAGLPDEIRPMPVSQIEERFWRPKDRLG